MWKLVSIWYTRTAVHTLNEFIMIRDEVDIIIKYFVDARSAKTMEIQTGTYAHTRTQCMKSMHDEIILQRPFGMTHARGFAHHFYDAMRCNADIIILTFTPDKCQRTPQICVSSITNTCLNNTQNKKNIGFPLKMCWFFAARFQFRK